MDGRSCFRLDTTEAKLCKIEFIDKDVDCANRIVLVNPIFQAFREQGALPAIHTLNEAPHSMLPRIRSRESHSQAFSHSQGQKRTFECVRAMSALPPKADIGTEPRKVRFVPKADVAVRA